MKYLLSFFALFIAMNVAPTHASAEQRVSHYEAVEPKTQKEALSLLHSKIDAIRKVLKTEVLGTTELEAIHEISYSLEEAVDALNKDAEQKYQTILKEMGDAIQRIHFLSEHHEGAKIRASFADLEKTEAAYLAVE